VANLDALKLIDLVCLGFLPAVQVQSACARAIAEIVLCSDPSIRNQAVACRCHEEIFAALILHEKNEELWEGGMRALACIIAFDSTCRSCSAR